MNTVSIPLGKCQPAFHGTQLCIAIQHVLDGGTRISRRFLFDARNHPVARPPEITAVGVQLVQDKREQAGFSRTVGAGDADLLSRVNLQGGLLEQQLKKLQIEMKNSGIEQSDL